MAAVTQTPRHVDAIPRDEAASILAVHVATVDRLTRRGVLTPARRFAAAQLSREQVETPSTAAAPARVSQ